MAKTEVLKRTAEEAELEKAKKAEAEKDKKAEKEKAEAINPAEDSGESNDAVTDVLTSDMKKKPDIPPKRPDVPKKNTGNRPEKPLSELPTKQTIKQAVPKPRKEKKTKDKKKKNEEEPHSILDDIKKDYQEIAEEEEKEKNSQTKPENEIKPEQETKQPEEVQPAEQTEKQADKKEKKAEKKEKKKHNFKPLIIALIIILVLTGAGFYIYNVKLKSPGFTSDSKLMMSIEDGHNILTWKAQNSDSDQQYRVEIYNDESGKENKAEPLYKEDFTAQEITTAEGYCRVVLPDNIRVTDRHTYIINTIKSFSILGNPVVREGTEDLRATYTVRPAESYNLSYSVDLEGGLITFICKPGVYGEYSLYLSKNDGEKINLGKANAGEGDIIISAPFGENGFTIPEGNDQYTFSIDCVDNQDSMIFRDEHYVPVTLGRDAFLTGDLYISVETDNKNRYTFTWNETKGSGYIISKFDPENQSWKAVTKLGPDDERVFETGKLAPCKDYKYRVEALDTESEETGENNMKEVEFSTVPSVEYATVWSTQELPVYKNSTGDETIGTVPVEKALVVLDEKDGRFFVKTRMDEDGVEGYIDSSKCMINLPEYLGDLCQYDITNSYSSIFTVHGYAIPDVSGSVVSGYENVLLNDGTFLVPLLYPVAQRLEKAAETARENGYVIKIYDSFRPHAATRSVYDLTTAALNYVVPDNTFTRISISDYMDGIKSPVLSLSDVRKAEPVTEAATEEESSSDSDEDSDSEDEESDEDKKESKKEKKEEKKKKKKEEKTTQAPVYLEDTYSKVMLGDSTGYNLGSFLAADGSMHNYGIALDMTLVSLETGDELSMQSAIHDLSHNSVQDLNNENANLLKKLMEKEGFGMISSEWWHFQDNSAKEKYSPVVIENGVSIEGWKRDDNGWKYRDADGSYMKDKQTLGEKEYTFDQNGYLVQE